MNGGSFLQARHAAPESEDSANHRDARNRQRGNRDRPALRPPPLDRLARGGVVRQDERRTRNPAAPRARPPTRRERSPRPLHRALAAERPFRARPENPRAQRRARRRADAGASPFEIPMCENSTSRASSARGSSARACCAPAARKRRSNSSRLISSVARGPEALISSSFSRGRCSSARQTRAAQDANPLTHLLRRANPQN